MLRFNRKCTTDCTHLSLGCCLLMGHTFVCVCVPLYSWRSKLYVTPSRLVLLTGISLLGTCALIGIITGLLHWRERVSSSCHLAAVYCTLLCARWYSHAVSYWCCRFWFLQSFDWYFHNLSVLELFLGSNFKRQFCVGVAVLKYHFLFSLLLRVTSVI